MPYERSISPDLALLDQLRVGSRPSSPSKFPSRTLIYGSKNANTVEGNMNVRSNETARDAANQLTESWGLLAAAAPKRATRAMAEYFIVCGYDWFVCCWIG
jgi:hypothetical protein